MKLRNTQKAALFELVADAGLNPRQFSLNENDDNVEICLQNSDIHCRLSYVVSDESEFSGGWEIRMTPGVHHWVDYDWSEGWDTGLRDIVSRWANRVQEELTTPDPWATTETVDFSSLSVSEDESNSPFTVREFKTVVAGIEEIRGMYLQFSKESEDATAKINQKLDALLASGETLGRVDWLNQAISAIISISVTVLANPEPAKQAFIILKNTISGIIHLTPLVPTNLLG